MKNVQEAVRPAAGRPAPLFLFCTRKKTGWWKQAFRIVAAESTVDCYREGTRRSEERPQVLFDNAGEERTTPFGHSPKVLDLIAKAPDCGGRQEKEKLSASDNWWV